MGNGIVVLPQLHGQMNAADEVFIRCAPYTEFKFQLHRARQVVKNLCILYDNITIGGNIGNYKIENCDLLLVQENHQTPLSQQ